jgi:hypothetical protein
MYGLPVLVASRTFDVKKYRFKAEEIIDAPLQL